MIHSIPFGSAGSLVDTYDTIDDAVVVLDQSNELFMSAPSGVCNDSIMTKVFDDVQLNVGDLTEALIDKDGSIDELVVTLDGYNHAYVSAPNGIYSGYKICSINMDCDWTNIAMDHDKTCLNGIFGYQQYTYKRI